MPKRGIAVLESCESWNSSSGSGSPLVSESTLTLKLFCFLSRWREGILSLYSLAMEPAAKPVVVALLHAAGGSGRVLRLGLTDQGFNLAALHALGKVLLAKPRSFPFSPGHAGAQRFGMSRARLGFDLCGNAFDGIRSGRNAIPSPALASSCGSQCALERMQIGQRGIERKTLLLFFEVANAKQAAEGGGNRHGYTSAANCGRRRRVSAKGARSSIPWVRKPRSGARAFSARSRSGSEPGL